MKKTAEEFELKVDLTEIEMAALRRRSVLRSLGTGPAATRWLRSIYFDTPDHRLSQQGAALRLRKVDDRWIQTVKIGGGVVAGVSRLLECEAEVSGPELDPSAIANVRVRKAVIAALDSGELAPVFETRIRRTTRPLQTSCGETAELALDVGEIIAGEARRPIIEAELELLSDDPSAIFSLAEQIFDGAPMRFARYNKAARGFQLARGEEEPDRIAERAETRLINPDHSIETAFEAIFRDCLRMIAANASLVMDDEGPEGPHQLRVGLRRLRSAIKSFRPAIRRGPMKDVERAARDWARVLGELRDADVLAEEIVAPAAEAMGKSCGLLLEALEAHRTQTRAAVRRRLVAERFGAFSLDLAAAVETRRWAPKKKQKRKALKQPVQPFAAVALQNAWDDVASWGNRIDELTTPERHEMRKALKTFRYAVDFFSPAFDPDAVKDFGKMLRKLQNGFGFLNDLATAEGLPDLFIDHPEQKRLQKLAGKVIDWHEERAHETWDKAVSRWRSLSKAPKFWL